MMKRILIVAFILLLVSACGNQQAKTDNKNTAPKTETVVEDLVPDDMSQPDTVASPSKKIQSSREETEEDKARKLNQKRARTAFKNGVAYSKKGEMEKAKEAFRLVLDYDPENDKACNNLGKIYYGMGQKDIALSYYEDAVRFNPEDSASMVGAGLILFERKDYNAALEYYNKAIKIAPEYALAFYDRGTLLGYQKNYGGALIDMNKAIKIDPNNSKYYMNRGLANYYLNRFQQACDDWDKAASMGNAEAKKALKLYCKKLGQ